jgi:CTD kinase subunit alpha
LPDPEDDENPFRPPADLRAEDENSRKKRKTEISSGSGGGAAAAPSAPKTAEELAAQAEREKNKISFSIKGRATMAAADRTPIVSKSETSPLMSKRVPSTISPLVQGHVPKSSNYVGNTRVGQLPPRPSPTPAFRKEMVRKKRLKPRPQLTEDFAHSDSVYYRKTGNESVVGSGTYGKVYKAIHVYTGGMVALKKIRMEGERDGVSSHPLKRCRPC